MSVSNQNNAHMVQSNNTTKEEMNMSNKRIGIVGKVINGKVYCYVAQEDGTVKGHVRNVRYTQEEQQQLEQESMEVQAQEDTVQPTPREAIDSPFISMVQKQRQHNLAQQKAEHLARIKAAKKAHMKQQFVRWITGEDM